MAGRFFGTSAPTTGLVNSANRAYLAPTFAQLNAIDRALGVLEKQREAEATQKEAEQNALQAQALQIEANFIAKQENAAAHPTPISRKGIGRGRANADSAESADRVNYLLRLLKEAKA